MHKATAHQQLTGAQPVPEQQPPANCPRFIPEHDATRPGTSGQSGPAVLAASPPAPGALSASSLAGQHAKQGRAGHCASCAQQLLKHCWIVNTGLVTNPKHSTLRATRKKITLSQQKPAHTFCFHKIILNVLKRYICLNWSFLKNIFFPLHMRNHQKFYFISDNKWNTLSSLVLQISFK